MVYNMTKTKVEYASENITVYPSCPFKCRYCWAAQPLWRKRICNPHPLQEAVRLRNARKPRIIVISFTSDPYPWQEQIYRLTRQVLQLLALSKVKHRVMVLTKCCLVKRDFDVLKENDFWLGMTLTSTKHIEDEPFADSNPYRIKTLQEAHEEGISTWSSLEPWLPRITNPVEIIKETHTFIDFYVLGRLNYAKRFGYDVPDGYYKEELPKAVELLDRLKKDYIIKKELRACLGAPTVSHVNYA